MLEPMSSPFSLTRALEALAGTRKVLVCPHDNPDPDALAAARAMATLLSHELGAEVTVAFGGIIGRAENRAMVRELNMKLRRLDNLDLEDFDGVFFVDTQPQAQNHSVPDTVTVLGCIDHHEGTDTGAGIPWFDVRSGGETTSAIALQYLVARGVEVDTELATAILYALKTDTRDFSREATDRDLDAHAFVVDIADRRTLGSIMNPRLEHGYYTALQDALEDTDLYGPVATVLLSRLLYPDLVAEMADLFVRRRGTDWCLCAGPHDDSLRFSLRTEIESANAGQIARTLVRDHGGAAGGHGRSAGGSIPLADASDAVAMEQLWQHLVAALLQILDVDDEGQPLLERA